MEATHAKYKELKAAGDQEALKAWRDERLQYIQERKEVSPDSKDKHDVPDTLRTSSMGKHWRAILSR